MATSKHPVDVSRELAKLKHERKNDNLKRLPSNNTIQRRPLNHAPVASRFAGSDVQKVVYVSRKTPVMSAVKRVKKFLRQIEERARQGAGMLGKTDREALNVLSAASEQLKRSSEEVLVKASGRAMEQALRVGEWFKTKEEEMLCKVEVRTSSVTAIDDIVEKQNEVDSEPGWEVSDRQDTNMEDNASTESQNNHQDAIPPEAKPQELMETTASKQELPSSDTNQERKSRNRKRKRKREMYDRENLPEARLRWVKTVEIAISLRA